MRSRRVGPHPAFSEHGEHGSGFRGTDGVHAGLGRIAQLGSRAGGRLGMPGRGAHPALPTAP
ncbi:hypothetical protein [Yinghuangia aomiensis]|uniref:hypothetical protein n=1 Tax=Yinghuangia aomiensis TaxID=676205 RepID=UPI0031E75FAE